MSDLPKVTFVIPTLNEAKFIRGCLESIKKQDYPSDKIEVIVADGGSTDSTVETVREFGYTVVNNPDRLAEPGKQLAFSKADGKYVALLDADNEIASSAWLTSAIEALEQYPDALGFESYYLKHNSHSLLNTYLTSLLQISDPCARALAGKPRLLETKDNVQLFELPEDGSYPTGANGFIFRRDLIGRLPVSESYHEASFFPMLIQQGTRNLVKIQGCGIYHHYVTTWTDFFRKRQRAMMIYMLRKETASTTWDKGTGMIYKCAVILYLGTIIGPLLEGIIRAAFSGKPEWLLHPAASLVSVTGNVLGVLRYKRLKSSEDRKYASADQFGDINR